MVGGMSKTLEFISGLFGVGGGFLLAAASDLPRHPAHGDCGRDGGTGGDLSMSGVLTYWRRQRSG